MNVGYVVEERENKTKVGRTTIALARRTNPLILTQEYLRIYGLRTWVNNLVWVARSMVIYMVLIVVVTSLSMLVLPKSGSRSNSVRKALFNYTHWTVIATVLFVYAIQVSSFSVLFGQFFKRRKA